jgi:zinc transport system substrate-binding protein
MFRKFAYTLALLSLGSVLTFASGTKEATAASSAAPAANGKASSYAGTEVPLIAVSILPQRYFVNRIAGTTVRTLVLVGPGQDPHSYEPSPKQMAELAVAKAWVRSNTDFEIALNPKIKNLYPSLMIVDGTEGVAFRPLEAHHDEGEATDHNDGGGINIDRHTWLGHTNANIMAKHIKDTLVTLFPQNKALYETNYQSLINDIDREFTALKTELAPLKGRTVFVYHPAFGYFLDEFGIHQEAVETGGKEPTAKDLSVLIEKARADKVAAIFVQAQFPVAAAQTVAQAVGAQVLPLDPLAEDWLTNIGVMGKSLMKALK